MADEQPIDPIEAAKKYWKDFPEAPYSDSFKWVDGAGFEHLTTVRGWSDSGLYQNIARMVARIDETGGKPIRAGANAPAPSAQAPARDETGVPVVDPDGNPVMGNLPQGVRRYTVAGVFHDTTKTGKDVLKVVTIEKPYNNKYGVSCFHPEGFDGWKSWPIGPDNKFAPPATAKHVIIRDPEGDNKYADVVEFQA